MITKRWQICWPPVSDEDDIHHTIVMGCLAASLWGLSPALNVIAGPLIIIFETHDFADVSILLKSLVFFLIALSIGWGIYKKNIIASVAGLMLSSVDLVAAWVAEGIKIKNSITAVITIFMFLHSTRGIIAYKRIMKEETNKEPEKV